MDRYTGQHLRVPTGEARLSLASKCSITPRLSIETKQTSRAKIIDVDSNLV